MTQQDNSAALAVPPDNLAALAPAAIQRRAAQLSQDAFARVFRLTLSADDTGRAQGVATLHQGIVAWADEVDGDENRALRLALVFSGLDQWGLAYSRAFGLNGIPGLTELLGSLRNTLDPQADAHLQRQFAAIDAAEGNAIDFKIEVRRSIHLALWHAMIASDDRDQATAILTQLGTMMFALIGSMPTLGWRLIADALAHIQIQCLAHSLAADGLGREMTTSLFAALARELPADKRDLVMSHSSQAVLAWQAANRGASDSVH